MFNLPGLTSLPAGQQRVALALLSEETGRTYPEIAASLGISLGSVHTHLRRIRQQRPEVYAAVMEQRRRQLAARYEEASARDEARSGFQGKESVASARQLRVYHA